MKRFLIWEELTIKWEDVPYLWEDVAVIIEAFEALGGGAGRIREQDPWKDIEKKLPKKLAKRFLEVVVRVNGEKFEETREVELKKTMTIDHIKKTFDQFGKSKIVKVDVKKQK